MAASNLAIRVGTAAVGVAVLLPLLFFAPPSWFFALVLVASAMAAWELHHMAAPRDLVSRIVTVAATCATATTLYALPDRLDLLVAILLGTVVVQGVVHLFRADPIETVGTRYSVSVAAVVYVGCLLPFVAILDKSPMGPRWVLLALVAAWLGDSGAYFAGTAFGKHRIAPKISPKKSWEGGIGGLVAAAAGCAAVRSLLLRDALPMLDAIAVGLVGGVVGPIGDFVESLLKRSFGVKDSGTLLPGHGGMLDRVDGLMFVAPAAYVYLRLRGLV